MEGYIDFLLKNEDTDREKRLAQLVELAPFSSKRLDRRKIGKIFNVLQ